MSNSLKRSVSTTLSTNCSKVLSTSPGLVAISLVMLLSTAQVNAASQCKGLENSACNQNASCGWVNGYERKDGRKVKSFCRTSNKSKPSVKPAKNKPVEE